MRSEYVAWQVGTHWSTARTFAAGLGGFSVLKDEASEANACVRRAGGDLLTDALARVEALDAERDSGAAGDEPEPPAFAELLSAALAGPHAEAQAPRQ